MRRYIIILLAVAMTNVAFSQKDANYNKIKRSYTVNSDGTIDYNYRKELKVISLRSFFSVYGETFIVYNPEFQKLKINESYTVRKDGSKVQTPANAFVEQLPSTCTNCQRYNGIREMVVVHTALEYDATIVLDYTITSATADLNEVIDWVENAPIDNYEVSVTLPQGKKLYYDMQNSKVKPSIKGNTYTWNMKKLKQSAAEYYAPSQRELYPVLYLSSKSMSDEVPMDSQLNEYNSLINSLKVAGDKMKTAVAIRNYVANYINHNNIPLALVNNKVSTSVQTLSSGCGTTMDKAVLVRDMLIEAGFEASLNIPTTIRKSPNGNFATSDESNVMVSVVIDGKTYDMSPISTAEPVQCLKEKRISHFSNSTLNLADTNIRVQAQIQVDNAKAKDVEKLKLNVLDTENEYYNFSVPQCGIDILPEYLTSKRSTPVVCGKTNESYSFNILLPENVKYIGQPVDIKYEKPFGSIEIKIFQKEDTLVVVRKLTIDDEQISVKDYKAFRQMMIDWRNPNYTNIIFKYAK
ncbi:MAG: DUF3857 domain-containing protein [Bacteroidales bacterium]|nr:DUF3857 domain-containing protein [Bacteroidales bacterium]